MKTIHPLLAAAIVAAAIGVTACDLNKQSTTTPLAPTATVASVPSLVGTWGSTTQSTSATPSSVTSSCTDIVWNITTQTNTDVAGTFTGTCLGNPVTGNGTGHVNGSAVAITITGKGSVAGQASCAFTINGTGTLNGEVITVVYTGSTCLGSLSGTQTLQRSTILPDPQVPALQSPADGATVDTLRPTLVVANVNAPLATDSMQYVFDVSSDSAMSSLVVTQTVGAGGGQTSFTLGTDLSAGTRYYWRARSVASGRASANSAVRSFVTPAPPARPDPNADQLDMSQAEIIDNPADLASWARTAKITSVDFSTGYVMVDFDKRLTGAWPESDFGVEYTLGMCFFLQNQWHCSAVIQFWTGRDLEASGPASEIWKNWYYGRWGIMNGHQPAQGELVGIFVAQGNLRDVGMSTLHERSNVVVIPFGTNYTAR